MNRNRFLLLPYFLGVLFISPYVVAASKPAQEIALNEIFNGLKDNSTISKPVRYGAIFTKLVQDKLGDVSELKGYECRLKVSLSDSGNVEHVSMSNQNALCRKGFNAVWEVGNFPMPDKKEDAKKLKDINLMLIP
ncbi:cell envelope integrity protein TolA [Vibrio aestuarianus]|jgi:hypothetical protein|uniref:cell envelope integrity protein TolA n=1 Tax=Vibrio aestuarianus TaxID=28171 RepID=UPI0021C49B70|nr:cell envelope integrity protein TolA [Vibrio aestuarianus]MDE1231586.1 cell envelope integrity protein TolA [Vibrio aestuarianus]CAH8242503.1 conserved exported hypothetical protein [Vibrio aestuarianus]